MAGRLNKVIKIFGVPYGSPQENLANMAERIKDGFQFLMPAPGRDQSALTMGHQLSKRA